MYYASKFSFIRSFTLWIYECQCSLESYFLDLFYSTILSKMLIFTLKHISLYHKWNESSFFAQCPLKFIHQCKKQFKVNYLESYQWIVYRSSLDSTFCNYSVYFFPPKIKMGNLLANNLVSITKFFKRLTIIRADKFLKSFENPRHRVENQFSGS